MALRSSDYIERGRKGENKILSFGFDKEINPDHHRILPGLFPACYYLIGAESHVGKTTLADTLLNRLIYQAQTTGTYFKVLYLSFELSRLRKELEFKSVLYYLKHDEDIALKTLAGWDKDKPMTDEQYRKQLDVTPYLEDYFNHIDMIDTGIGVETLEERVHDWILSHGKYKKVGGKNVFQIKDGGFLLIVTDTLNLGGEEGKYNSEKKIIDKLSRASVNDRNEYGVSYFNIQQFSTGISSIERQQFSKDALKPQKIDFGGSSYTFNDADIVIGGLLPAMYDIKNYAGFPILDDDKAPIWGRNLSFWWCIKNRMLGEFGCLPMLRRTSAPELEPITDNTWTTSRVNEYINEFKN